MAIEDDIQRLLREYIRPGSSEGNEDKRRLVDKAVELAPQDVLCVFLDANLRLIDLAGKHRVRTRAVARTGKDGVGLRYDTGKGAKPTEIQTILLPTNRKWAGHIVAYFRGHDEAPVAGAAETLPRKIAGKPQFLVTAKPSEELVGQVVEALKRSSLWTG